MLTNKITVRQLDYTSMLYHSTLKPSIYGVTFRLALCAYVNPFWFLLNIVIKIIVLFFIIERFDLVGKIG
jgi:hypothetical protein